MLGTTLKLGSPEVAAVIDGRYAAEPDGWRKRRLLAVKLAAKGAHASAEVAELCGIARSHLFVWLKRVREEGLAARLVRAPPGPRAGLRRGVPPKVRPALVARLEAQELAGAEQARRWRREQPGIGRRQGTVWSWRKKARGVRRVPRPRPSRKNPDAAAGGKSSVAEKLGGRGTEAGSRVKVWFMDDGRARSRRPFWPAA